MFWAASHIIPFSNNSAILPFTRPRIFYRRNLTLKMWWELLVPRHIETSWTNTLISPKAPLWNLTFCHMKFFLPVVKIHVQQITRCFMNLCHMAIMNITRAGSLDRKNGPKTYGAIHSLFYETRSSPGITYNRLCWSTLLLPIQWKSHHHQQHVDLTKSPWMTHRVRTTQIFLNWII